MAHKNVGIFYNGSTALGVEVEGTGSNIRATFYEPADDSAVQSGPELLSSLCTSMGKPKAPALAIGGNLYMSHDHRSEFEDIQQAAQTLKFDIEDILAVDAEKIAVCYQEKPTNTTNVDLIVYTAERQALQSIFEQMDSVGSDPVSVTPSVVAWQKYLASAELIASQPSAYISRCGSTVYLMVLNSAGQPVISRKFPDVDDSRFYQIIDIELNRCSITLPGGETLTNIYYHEENVDHVKINAIAGELGLKLNTISEPSFAKAAAIGAALANQKGKATCNFRADNLEPAHIKKDRQKALYAMSALACLIILSWIGIMINNTSKYNQIAKDAAINIKDAARYCRITSRRQGYLHRELETELKRIERLASGQGPGNTDSATYTMNMAFRALSKLNPEFDLNISSIAFKPDEIKRFSGTVPDLEALKQLRDVLQSPDSGLEIVQETSNTAGNRQAFEMPMTTAAPKQTARRRKTTENEKE